MELFCRPCCKIRNTSPKLYLEQHLGLRYADASAAKWGFWRWQNCACHLQTFAISDLTRFEEFLVKYHESIWEFSDLSLSKLAVLFSLPQNLPSGVLTGWPGPGCTCLAIIQGGLRSLTAPGLRLVSLIYWWLTMDYSGWPWLCFVSDTSVWTQRTCLWP